MEHINSLIDEIVESIEKIESCEDVDEITQLIDAVRYDISLLKRLLSDLQGRSGK